MRRSRHDLEVRRLQRDAVDPRQRRRDRPLVPRKLERLEVFMGGLVGALAQVQQEARLLLDLGEERLRVARVDVGDPAPGLGQQLVAGLLDVADDPPVVTPDARSAEQRDPLRGRHAADERLALDVADERGEEVGRLADRLHRRGHELVVRSGVAPRVAVRVLLRNLPERQRVVSDVVVKFDQAGEHRSAGLERHDARETFGRRIAALGDRGDRGVRDPDRAVHHDGRLRVHGHDPAGDRPLGAAGGIDRGRAGRNMPTVHGGPFGDKLLAAWARGAPARTTVLR